MYFSTSFFLFQGPCCTNDCFFKNGDMCRDDNGCRGESFCDGRGPQCPNSDLKPNKTVCHQEFVCYKGVSGFFDLSFQQTTINKQFVGFQKYWF